jgi:hypothetical protein
MNILKSGSLMAIAFIALLGCSPANKDDVKRNAVKVFEENGFKVVGYQGYQWGTWGLFDYGGACVWYTLEKIPKNWITYDACLKKVGR